MSSLAAVLAVPQWQGYAVDDRPRDGALAVVAALETTPARAIPIIEVPPWHAVSRDDGGGGAVHGLGEIVAQAQAVVRWLDVAAPARLLVIGGDCGSDAAPIAWQVARHGAELGVLYLDAHADLNTPASSPSGRFHGMVLRTALGDGPPALTGLAPRPLTPAQLVMAGVRDLDEPERAYLAAAGIAPWSPAAIVDGRVAAALDAHPARRWHVHLDLDVVDPGDLPEVTVPTPGGPPLDAITSLLVAMVSRHDVVGITVTEHVGGITSARRVAEVISALRRAGW